MSTIESEYICDYCSRSFTRKHNLQTHIENCHLNSTCFCDICEARFGSPAGLQLHLSRGHNRYGQPSPECDICGRIFTRKQNITSHMNTVHMHIHRPDIRCHLCSKYFTSERNLKRHLHQLHNPDFAYLFCDECNKVFKGKHSLIAHIQTVHTAKRGTVRCHLCVKVYTNKRNLKRHMEINHHRNHQDKGEFKCNSCSKTYTSNQSLKRHTRSMHSDDKLDCYKCKFCTKIIAGKKNYRTHTRLHYSQERQSSFEYLANFTKDLKCDTCDVGYDNETSLRQHIKSDHGFQQFYTFCKKSLLLKSIDRHRNRHRKQNFYYCCEFCSRSFNTVYDLKDHMRNNHDTEYALSSCNVCFGKFFSKETMIDHKKSCLPPTNVNRCNNCDKLFTDISSLEFHIRVFHPQISKDCNTSFDKIQQSTDKNFQCEQCDRMYHNSRALKNHMKRTHWIGGTVECKICGKICNNKYYLESHLRLVHNNDSMSKNQYCNDEFQSKQILKHKETTNQEVQRYKCDECASLFKERKGLRKHIRAKHPDSTCFPRCPVCSKQFESVKSCRTHQKYLHASNTNQCSQCGSSFETKDALNTHAFEHHKNQEMNNCSLNILKERDPIDHQAIRNATLVVKHKSPRCILCLKDFSARKTLKRHIKKFHWEFDIDELANFGTERPEFDVHCVDCIKNFTDDYHFGIYLKWKHLAKSIIFKCETCNKSYNTLEYSIQRYKRNLDISKNKLYLSELCTTEMSDADTQMDFGSHKIAGNTADVKSQQDSISNDMEYDSSDGRSDIEIKSEPESSSDIKLELRGEYTSDCDVKTEPPSP